MQARVLSPASLAALLVPLAALSACATAGGPEEGGGNGSPDADTGAAQPDASLPPDAAPPSACELALAELRFDFESGVEGFTHDRMPEVAGSGISWRFDHWEHGDATGGCAAGQGCFGTSIDGNYVQCGRAYLMSPPIDLSACIGENVELSFQHNFDFWTGDFSGQTWFDGGLVEISPDGQTWHTTSNTYPGTIAINPDMGSSFSCIEKDNFYIDGKPGFVGASGGWTSESITIPSTLVSASFRVRFVYTSGVSSQTTNQETSRQGTRPGWYIDELSFQ